MVAIATDAGPARAACFFLCKEIGKRTEKREGKREPTEDAGATVARRARMLQGL